MAVVGERRAGCDGCGRTVGLEELTTVTMPDGEQVVCCPECTPHARAAAQKGNSLDQRRGTCDGCTEPCLTAELEDIVLDDGTVLSCCPSCVAEAPGHGGSDGADTDATDTDTARADGSATTGSGETAGSETGSAETDGDRNRCSQCRELVAVERFRVTTIDERTERLCPDCKADAEEKGIITDVAMRKQRAREVLGVDADADDEAIREAFHAQVKRAHPDRESGSQSAFKLVTEAYERLRADD
ncbi:J domain-containing protein [Natrinema versiforme]|uniref:Heat shock protein DnaJ domain-containing protein n=1 Tax=Natrinema versiforme JCM 10478 TaxID=1227496 RepID=L9XQ93_9EURY|nr:J domain-containing protein [Natrinema versiforme]ELY63974.1 heat shock protein DnaJ domain-containing protein [Natrinema versiforme JCM 10478]